MSINSMVLPGEGGDADEELRRFDLSVAVLQERVLIPAQTAASLVSPLAPRGYAGQTRHAVAVSCLRMLLLAHGWEQNDDDNVARIRHVGRGLAIVVATGNALTGLPFAFTGRSPSTKWPKGDITRAAAADNQQLALFDSGGGIPDAEDANVPSFETWMLLMRALHHEVRAELSRPISVSQGGFINAWGQRIILPSMPNDGSAVDPDFGDDGEIPDVPVDPR